MLEFLLGLCLGFIVGFALALYICEDEIKETGRIMFSRRIWRCTEVELPR